MCIFVLSNAKLFSQKILVNGKESNGKLSWTDFIGDPDQKKSFNAFTAYTFRTKFGSVNFFGDSAVVNNLEVILELDSKNTWAKKDRVTDLLLVHEQGHFNLGILSSKEILAKFKATKFTKQNYNSLLQSIINDVSKKYRDLGIKYDDETKHSENREQQLKWNSFITEELAKY